MRHCLVTGGAGFIGSHLAEALLAAGHRVSVIDDESTGSVQNLAAVADHARFRYVRGSVADDALMGPLVDEADEVYHLAAVVGVELVVRDPRRTLQMNVNPTAALLERLAAKQSAGRPTPLFLASSSEVYGKNPRPVYREEDDLVFGATTRARWSYGISKAVDEILALDHHRRRGLPLVIARLFNVVGPRQSPRHGFVLPRLVQAALAGGPLVVFGDGRQVRSFAHVADVVAAIPALVAQPAARGLVVNLGSDEAVTILELARRVGAAVDPALAVRLQSYGEAYGDGFEECPRRVPDLTRLRSLLDFRPRMSLDETIRQTVAWWRAAR